jgi:hypothetical protein
MTTYELPCEPDVEVIWTVFSAGASQPTVTRRWTRAGTAWRQDGETTVTPWPLVLHAGVVHDTHPALGDVAPTPWKWDDVGAWCIRDANDQPIEGIEAISSSDAALIVRAVNAYAERLG